MFILSPNEGLPAVILGMLHIIERRDILHIQFQSHRIPLNGNCYIASVDMLHIEYTNNVIDCTHKNIAIWPVHRLNASQC